MQPPQRLPDEVLARRKVLPRKPDGVTLTGTLCELRPLDLDRDLDGLFAVQNVADADELIWKWMKGGPFKNADGLYDYLAAQLDTPDMLPFTVHDRATDAPLGVAAYMSNHPLDLKIELGSIWYGPSAQRTGVSREATHLLCAHAFALGYRRVEWKCDANNTRSRRAALSYGFTFEGIQEAHMIVKGRNRDTAWFRILDHEWSGPKP
jgi:RimJ/RimL family protein N-acetyltransferase